MNPKRALDLLVSVPAFAISLPIQGLIALALRATMGAPIIFRQQRPGLDGEPFEMIKFRTMQHPDPGRGLMTDEDRLTRFGSILRASSLDELPTLWNVIQGDMSLVGPRPLLMQYLTRYTTDQARRHEVPPGLTGLAQVNGRNGLTWEQKFAFDLEYVDSRSMWLDLKILARTISVILRRDGISATNSATMPEFLPPGTAGQ